MAIEQICIPTSNTLSVMDSLMCVGDGVSAFFNTGDLGVLVKALLNAVPVVAFFLAIYAIMSYLGRVTLFRDQEHKKFANMFAIGVAMAALIQGLLFNIFVNILAKGFLSLIFVLVAIFAVIIALKKLRTSSIAASSGLAGAQVGLNQSLAERSEARRDRYNAQHETQKDRRLNRRENRLLRRENKTIKEAETAVQGKRYLWGLVRSKKGSLESQTAEIKTRLINLEKVLGEMKGLSLNDVNDKVRDQITKEASKLVGVIQKQHKWAVRLNEIFNKEEHLELQGIVVEHKENNQQTALMNSLGKLLHDENILNSNNVRADAQFVKDAVTKDQQLKQFTQVLNYELESRKGLIKKAEQLDQDMITRLQQLDVELNAIGSSLQQGNLGAAITYVHQSLDLVQNIEIDERAIGAVLDKWDAHTEKVRILEQRLVEILNRIRRDIAQSS